MTIWFLRDMGGKNCTDTGFASVRSGNLFILKNNVVAKYSRLKQPLLPCTLRSNGNPPTP